MVNSTSREILVLLQPDSDQYEPRVTASCTATSPHTWWVTQVLVQPANYRGQGLGSRALALLLEAFQKQVLPGVRLLVSPGGYEGDTERQQQFYVKNGFVAAPELGEGIFIWRPTAKVAG